MKKNLKLILLVFIFIFTIRVCFADSNEFTNSDLQKAIENLDKFNSFAFKIKADVNIADSNLMYFDLEGNFVKPDKTYTKGKVKFFGFDEIIESIKIGGIQYDKDSKNGEWKKQKKSAAKGGVKFGDPVSKSKEFADKIMKFKYLKEEKLNGKPALVYEIKLKLDKEMSSGITGKQKARLYIDKELKVFNKLYFEVEGKDASGNKSNMLMSFEFFDFDKEFKIEEPK